MMEIWQGIVDFVLCWLKLAALWWSVPVGFSLLYRYCGAPYVLEREERKRARRAAKESPNGSSE
ncbi:MAG: hypothetical protein IJZ68_09515 [Bacteroidaceae bacterium]|nr:hypothetical protein [Bacteroidaceae bacterium]